MAEGPPKEKWGSRWGFIMAASGSAIGLGNIVFFSANAYKYGAGAFYFPYLIALIVVGLPLMILEFGLGAHTRKAFPQSLRQFAGKSGEFVGWLAIINATVIVMYYVTIIAWVMGMLIGSFGPDLFGGAEEPDPVGKSRKFFFDMLGHWRILGLVAIVWLLNVGIVWKGVSSIETATKFLVPAMWIMMIILIIQGLSFQTGFEGVKLLFTPQFEVMKHTGVWRGAFGQIFFSLSLGFGIMTAYTSKLEKGTDIPSTAMSTSFMNCSFEFIAGIAVFAMLFHFAIAPQASTLSMMFWVVPGGIAQFGDATKMFGILFFFLLLIAGLSSSISLVEALASAAIDKFHVSRKQVVAVACIAGLIGSCLFALPMLVDNGPSTLGLTLLDFTSHWAQEYGLLIIGILECLLLGWGIAVKKMSESVNEDSKMVKLGPAYLWLVRVVIPVILISLLVFSLVDELNPTSANPKGELYNYSTEVSIKDTTIPAGKLCLFGWAAFVVITALVLTLLPEKKRRHDA